MKPIVRRIAAILLALLAPIACAQTTKSADEIRQEAQQAETMYKAQNFLGALPLYKELYEHDPKSTFYLEHYAMCVASDAQNRTTAAEGFAQRKQALALFQQAQSLGDTSNFSQVMIEKLQQSLAAPSNDKPLTPAQVILNKAEKAFASGDLPGALALYQQALALDPKYYEAALFAGDVEFKQHHQAEAGKWYAQATAMDPNRETAWRYWGDSLMAAGEPQAARNKYISAIVAEPYSRTPWVGLQQWAKAQNVLLAAPEIKLPAPPKVDPSKPNTTNITIDAATLGNPTSSAWMMYSMERALWHGDEFKKHFPDEPQYRHTLEEESKSLNMVVTVAKEQKIPEKKLDLSLKNLMALQKDNMLDAWILISNADDGIAHDYVAYRESHRDLLKAYIEKYIIH